MKNYGDLLLKADPAKFPAFVEPKQCPGAERIARASRARDIFVGKLER